MDTTKPHHPLSHIVASVRPERGGGRSSLPSLPNSWLCTSNGPLGTEETRRSASLHHSTTWFTNVLGMRRRLPDPLLRPDIKAPPRLIIRAQRDSYLSDAHLTKTFRTSGLLPRP
ncbi:hypothetical protein AAFF_G00358430 [Aldrovandia affinis]|uniref:Uncharacterized protein n=1 Tax=Aldrovandia affinis TaxID=143900 RepID=A0AAD7T8X6_9TELE|nr:hypothetical protein AAFF_G00358430 [Aldrovandia affinis]